MRCWVCGRDTTYTSYASVNFCSALCALRHESAPWLSAWVDPIALERARLETAARIEDRRYEQAVAQFLAPLDAELAALQQEEGRLQAELRRLHDLRAYAKSATRKMPAMLEGVDLRHAGSAEMVEVPADPALQRRILARALDLLRADDGDPVVATNVRAVLARVKAAGTGAQQ